MTDNTLIISLTSWTKRIYTAFFTLTKLYDISLNKDVQIIFNLSQEEFPYGINSLPYCYKEFLQKSSIIINVDEGNIMAHKKLMPTLEKYPYNDILVVDDDKLYEEDMIDNFLQAHNKFPHDVIVGRSHFRIYGENNKFISKPIVYDLSKIWETPLSPLFNCKQASGLAGTLYPVGTFTDPLFFDRKLMMESCYYSDEDWQWFFNIKENRTLRTNFKVKVYSGNNDGDKYALYNNYGQSYYEQYYYNFQKIWPDFYDRLNELNDQFIRYYPELSV